MTQLNDDGLTPGQAVDFETMRRIELERKSRPAVEVEPVAVKRGRPFKKMSGTDEG